jgi:hypothetical protein
MECGMKTPEKSVCITLKDILGMTIKEYLFKHSEEIAEEVLNNNPLLKELKDNENDRRVSRRIRKHGA